jgi:hypothetical protein
MNDAAPPRMLRPTNSPSGPIRNGFATVDLGSNSNLGEPNVVPIAATTAPPQINHITGRHRADGG